MTISTLARDSKNVADGDVVSDRQPRMPKFGVALFENASEKAGGWASVAGGEEIYFRSTTDLPNDNIWITSVESDGFSSLMSQHHLRASDYFKSKLKGIAADFGFGLTGADARKACRSLSEIANRVALTAAQVYKWDDPIEYFRQGTLADDIRVNLPRPNGIMPSMVNPLGSAFQPYSSPDCKSFEDNSIIVTLRFNRLSYAKKILSTPVPDGSWRYMGAEESSSFRYSLDQALNPEIPCLVEATIELRETDEDIANLVAFGKMPSDGYKKKPVLRNWISQPELMWLSRFAKVKISRVYFASGARPLPESVMLPSVMTIDPLWELSVSAGIVAESHWNGLASKIVKYGQRDPKNKNAPQRVSTVWATWLRAADRAYCFEAALRLFKGGFSIFGYGSGAVIVRVARPRLHELVDLAMEMGFAHPCFRELFERNSMTD